MRCKQCVLAVASVVFLICPVAQGNTQIGFGPTKCAQYIEFRQQSPDAARAFGAWVLGYLSGINFVIHTTKGVDLLGDQTSEKIVSFVQGYCRASPSKTVTEAANEYWFGLSDRARK